MSGQEVSKAGKLVARRHQVSHITPEILRFLSNLNVLPDNESILRCFGRLGRSSLDDEAKYPFLVLQNSWLSRKIIDDCHWRNHPSTSHTMSTTAFLGMPRRLVPRGGTPQTITSDNSPIFTLADTVLSECVERLKTDDNLLKKISTREIEWKYITPYAPWRCGVYERLIKSVKLALFKTIGKTSLFQGCA